MLDRISYIVNLPTPVRAVLAVACGASIVAMAYMFLPGQVYWIIFVGMTILAILGAGYALLVRKLRRRKAAPLERGLRENTTAAPQGVSEPAKRARLDELRKKFDDGLAKFKAAGKSLYELPWYVIVGESGSGKTEAIRHSNIGFPPGLQDQYQGAGGTINMDWWFTSNGVILDTAGRMLFEEVDSGFSNDWKSLLSLLRKNRPNCPINGLLLVIPSDSLLRDRPEEIQRKGGRIAQQFDLIQRTLDVRFPVFVVITKADLICGFREFFDNIDDPQLQHQMVGWSNPAPLDDPFRPDSLEQNLEGLLRSLRRRRLGVLMDPGEAGDGRRRIDLVDSLYTFPQAFQRVALPRLKRYLEMIFAGSGWSTRPPFLRGIYLTSSMREGDALDSQLAEVLDVPVEELPGGRVWQQDRSYFLRDAFIEKIFRETGLVTRATNARKQHRRRRAVVLGTGFLSVLALMALTWLGAWTFNKSLGRHLDYWSAAAQKGNWIQQSDGTYWRPAVSREGGVEEYMGGSAIRVGRNVAGADLPTSRYLADLTDLTRQPPSIPWIFSLAAAMAEDFEGKSRTAHRMVYESSLLRPAVFGARQRLADGEEKPWTPAEAADARDALSQLLWLEARHMGVHTQAMAEKSPTPSFDALIRFALRDPAEAKKWGADGARTALEQSLELVYAEEQGDWPAQTLRAGTPAAEKAIRLGVGRYIKSMLPDEGSIDSHPLLQKIAAFQAALKRYAAAEEALLDVCAKFQQPGEKSWDPPTAVAAVEEVRTQWQRHLADLAQAADELDTLAREPLELEGGAVSLIELAKAYEAVTTYIVRSAEKGCDTLRKASTPVGAAPASAPAEDAAPADILAWVRREITTRFETFRRQIASEAKLKELGGLEAQYLGEVKEAAIRSLAVTDAQRARLLGSPRFYTARAMIYTLASEALDRPLDLGGGVPLAALAGKVAAVRGGAELSVKTIRQLSQLAPTAFRFPQADKFSAFVCDPLAVRLHLYRILDSALETAPGTVDKIKAQVAAEADVQLRPVLPFSGLTGKEKEFDRQFNPTQAAAVVRGWRSFSASLGQQAGTEGSAPLVAPAEILDRNQLLGKYRLKHAEYARYLADYWAYWGRTVIGEMRFDAAQVPGDWEKLREQIANLNAGDVNQNYGRACKVVLNAIAPLADLLDDRELKQEALDTVERLQASLQTTASQTFIQQCGKAINAWIDLGSKSEQARELVLDEQASSFGRNGHFIIYSSSTARDYSRDYWTGLTTAPLSVLATWAQRQGQLEVKSLAKFNKFPLDLPSQDDSEMTEKELGDARESIDKLATAITRQDQQGKRIRDGGRPGIPATDELLDKLVMYNLTDKEKAVVSRRKAVLDALPPADKSYECVISFPVDRASESFLAYWAGGIRVVQGDRSADWLGEKGFEFKCVYPSKDPLVFRFYRWPDDRQADKPLRVLTVPGRWTAARLLHPGRLAEPAPSKDVLVWQPKTVGESRQVTIEIPDAPEAEKKPDEKKPDGKAQPVAPARTAEPKKAETRKATIDLKWPKPFPSEKDWPRSTDF